MYLPPKWTVQCVFMKFVVFVVHCIVNNALDAFVFYTVRCRRVLIRDVDWPVLCETVYFFAISPLRKSKKTGSCGGKKKSILCKTSRSYPLFCPSFLHRTFLTETVKLCHFLLHIWSIYGHFLWQKENNLQGTSSFILSF